MVLCASHLRLLNSQHVVLASASPRRSELLRQIGLTGFQVSPSSFDELLDKASCDGASGYARETARCKAQEVASRSFNGQLASVVIGADTVVEVDGVVLEKPADAADASRMLRSLSGRRHAVHTGVALYFPRRGQTCRSFSETTHVQFAHLTEDAIAAYVASGEPNDKAGAYGIQGAAAAFVTGIDGCYFNVVGLPLHRLATELVAAIEQGALEAEES